MAERALIGAILAALITAFARRRGTLDESGQWAAFGCGIASTAAGWTWAALLVAYFAAASVLTAYGATTKAARTQGTLPQVKARSAAQVLANGAVFSVLALKAGTGIWGPWGFAAFGALAAASADTWATEIGIALGGRPRSILNGSVVAYGMSGGVTGVGLLAAVAGTAFVACAATFLNGLDAVARVMIVVGAAGFVGAIVDSVLGAAFQARRRCENCREWTERRVHSCGYRTVHAQGVRWCSNDLVNLAATVVGAAGALGLSRLIR